MDFSRRIPRMTFPLHPTEDDLVLDFSTKADEKRSSKNSSLGQSSIVATIWSKHMPGNVTVTSGFGLVRAGKLGARDESVWRPIYRVHLSGMERRGSEMLWRRAGRSLVNECDNLWDSLPDEIKSETMSIADRVEARLIRMGASVEGSDTSISQGPSARGSCFQVRTEKTRGSGGPHASEPKNAKGIYRDGQCLARSVYDPCGRSDFDSVIRDLTELHNASEQVVSRVSKLPEERSLTPMTKGLLSANAVREAKRSSGKLENSSKDREKDLKFVASVNPWAF